MRTGDHLERRGDVLELSRGEATREALADTRDMRTRCPSQTVAALACDPRDHNPAVAGAPLSLYQALGDQAIDHPG